jgi:toxin ParE1/3/4
MSQLFFTPAADEDVLGILNHIAQHRPMTARKWYCALREKCEFLGDNPNMGQLRSEFGQGCRSFGVIRCVIYFSCFGRNSRNLANP